MLSPARYVLIALLVASLTRTVHAGDELKLRIVSSRGDSVSGDDVLVGVSASSHLNWAVTLDGHDITNSFRPVEGSAEMLALPTGLALGEHTLAVGINGAIQSSVTILVNPLSGPVFSGPHQEPFICQTAENGLGPAIDSECTSK